MRQPRTVNRPRKLSMISLRHKLWLGFGGLLVILIIVTALTVTVLTHYSRALERVFRENYDSTVYCNSMEDALDQLDVRAQHVVWQDSAATPAATRPATPSLIAKFEENLRLQALNAF